MCSIVASSISISSGKPISSPHVGADNLQLFQYIDRGLPYLSSDLRSTQGAFPHLGELHCPQVSQHFDLQPLSRGEDLKPEQRTDSDDDEDRDRGYPDRPAALFRREVVREMNEERHAGQRVDDSQQRDQRFEIHERIVGRLCPEMGGAGVCGAWPFRDERRFNRSLKPACQSTFNVEIQCQERRSESGLKRSSLT